MTNEGSLENNRRNLLRAAGLILLLSAALHVLSFVVAGITPDAAALIAPGILFALLAVGLVAGWQWLAGPSFVLALVGLWIALWLYLGPSTVPPWWSGLLIALNMLVAATLFLHIWRRR